MLTREKMKKRIQEIVKNYTQHALKAQERYSHISQLLMCLLIVLTCYHLIGLSFVESLLIYIVIELDDFKERLTFIFKNTKKVRG